MEEILRPLNGLLNRYTLRPKYNTCTLLWSLQEGIILGLKSILCVLYRHLEL